MAKPARSVLMIAVVVIALVIAAIIAVLVFPPSAGHFAPGSPEDVFQRYLTAYQNRDFAQAYEFFSAEAQKQLSLDDYQSYARSSYAPPRDSADRIVVDRVEGDSLKTTLYLTVENQSGSGFNLIRWTYQLTVPMVQESGIWKIDQLLLGTSPAPVMPVTK